MNLTFEQELQILFDIVEFKKYQRYDNLLYADYNGPKLECTIPEFVWNFCKYPCWAKGLIKEIEKKLVNCRPFLNILATSNDVKIEELYDDWDAAMEEVTCPEFPRTMIAYSSEYSNMKLKVSGSINDVDGDLWHGFLLSSHVLSQIKTLTMKIKGMNIDRENITKEFEFTGTQVVKRAKNFAEEDKEVWYMFSPFKHPILLCEEANIEYNFTFYTDGEIEIDEECMMVFGILNCHFREWIANTPINAKLCNKETIRYIKGIIDF